ncbi:EscU/YscU/HrcU family type III secretion system export apparatus switch protein, partial [Campylobacter armoricus]
MAADDQEKTEEPTSKKIEDARQEGNVPKSQDASAVAVLVIAVVVVLAMLPFIGERISGLYRFYQSFIGIEIDLKILQKIIVK